MTNNMTQKLPEADEKLIEKYGITAEEKISVGLAIEEARREERERIRGAFLEHFKGKGELFFIYGHEFTEKELLEPVEGEWNDMLQALKDNNKDV